MFRLFMRRRKRLLKEGLIGETPWQGILSNLKVSNIYSYIN